MANSQAGLILQHIRKLAAIGSEPLADRELVQRFVSARDEAAFAMLVRRHGKMVLRVCQRVLHHAHDAEDAFQATFLVLSRKAGSLRHPELVGNWLYGVAHRLALKAGIYASRRWAHESQVAARPPIDPLAELTGRELIAVLDEELSRLAEKYRAPLVLCCLEGTARDKAAQQLGWSLSTLKRRLEYGRKLLRRRLARRGLALSAALSASLLTADTGHAAVSATLIASTIQAALSYQSGQTVAVAGISKQAAALAEEVLRATLITKVKIAAVLFLAISVGAAEAALLARQVLEGKPAEAKEQAEPKSVASIPDQAKAEATNPTRFDPFGDPLPLGALARFGTVRWRHGDQVMASAFSPDGTTVASGSMDEAIHLWDARTGKLLRILRGHEAWVGSVFFTPDGKELIS